jgi:phosphohistidine phosphatase SixA
MIGFIVSLALGLLSVPCLTDAQHVVYLVRHAEQASDSDDPPLTEAGQRRARALVAVLKDASLTAIYVSELQRTMQTAEPLAQALQIEPTRLPRHDIEGLLGQLRTQHADGRVLIVSHSLTIPRVLKAFGHPEEVAIQREEYDRLFVIMPKPTGPPLVAVLRFSEGKWGMPIDKGEGEAVVGGEPPSVPTWAARPAAARARTQPAHGPGA